MKQIIMISLILVWFVGCVTLHEAAYKGDIEKTKELINKGADINAENENSRTPLHIATYWGHLGIVKFLLANGADINAKDSNGRTPLHLAFENLPFRTSGLEIMNLLIAKGANVNAKTIQGATPFRMAVDGGDLDLVKFMIARGADTNGYYLLDNPILNGDLEMVKLLVMNGADTKGKSWYGQNPLDVAQKYHRKPIIDYLTSKQSTKPTLVEPTKKDEPEPNPAKEEVAADTKPTITILGEVFAAKGKSVDLKHTGSDIKIGETLYIFQDGKPVSQLAVTQTFHTKLQAKVINTSVAITKGMSYGRLKK